YDQAIAKLGSELSILQSVPVEDIAHAGSPLLAEAITRLRAGRVICEANGIFSRRNPHKMGTSSTSHCCIRSKIWQQNRKSFQCSEKLEKSWRQQWSNKMGSEAKPPMGADEAYGIAPEAAHGDSSSAVVLTPELQADYDQQMTAYKTAWQATDEPLAVA